VSDDPTTEPATDSETLFRQYAGFVASFLHRLGAREAEIDDLVQDVFLTAHRKGGYRPGAASATTFLAQLALEAKHGKRRRDSRWLAARSHDAARAAIGVAPADPSQALVAKRAAARMNRALSAMDPGHRAVFILFELHGESCEAIAAGLELKLGTVYSRLHAARRAFRAAAARASILDGKDGKDDDDPRLFRARETA
jgi:RNA polymerase sigma-70 factor (ECF subfamily)